MPSETGGPAFPVPAAYSGGTVKDGMALRDYFAAQAMPQLMAYHGDRLAWEHRHIASEAYAIADAMIATRNQG